MMLAAITVAHTYKGKKTAEPQTFAMHPFAEKQGEHAGCYEIVHSRRGAEAPEHSGYVTDDQLAELFARGLIETLGLRLRLQPAEGLYPDSLPAKKVPRSSIAEGSDFARRVEAFEGRGPVTAGLRTVLAQMGLNVS